MSDTCIAPMFQHVSTNSIHRMNWAVRLTSIHRSEFMWYNPCSWQLSCQDFIGCAEKSIDVKMGYPKILLCRKLFHSCNRNLGVSPVLEAKWSTTGPTNSICWGNLLLEFQSRPHDHRSENRLTQSAASCLLLKASTWNDASNRVPRVLLGGRVLAVVRSTSCVNGSHKTQQVSQGCTSHASSVAMRHLHQ